MKRFFKTCLSLSILSLFLFLNAGCATHLHVREQGYEEMNAWKKTATVHSFFWGLIPGQLEVPKDYPGIGQVEVTNNTGYSLIGLLTLGIWQPVDVTYTQKIVNGDQGHPEASKPQGHPKPHSHPKKDEDNDHDDQ